MFKYTICGVVYDAKGKASDINAATDVFAQYDALLSFYLDFASAYDLVCTCQEGTTISRLQFKLNQL